MIGVVVIACIVGGWMQLAVWAGKLTAWAYTRSAQRAMASVNVAVPQGFLVELKQDTERGFVTDEPQATDHRTYIAQWLSLRHEGTEWVEVPMALGVAIERAELLDVTGAFGVYRGDPDKGVLYAAQVVIVDRGDR